MQDQTSVKCLIWWLGTRESDSCFVAQNESQNTTGSIGMARLSFVDLFKIGFDDPADFSREVDRRDQVHFDHFHHQRKFIDTFYNMITFERINYA